MSSIASVLSRLSPVAGRPVVAARSEAAAEQRDGFQAAEKGQESSSWMRAVGLGAAAMGAVMLAGCGSQLPTEQLGAPLAVQSPEQDRAQALHLEVIPASLGTVDLLRQTHLETHSDGKGGTTTTTEKDALKNVGVYLGNGIFLDRGMNLSLMPDRIFHEPMVPQDASEVTVHRGGLGGEHTVLRQSGAVTQVEISGDLDDVARRDSPDHMTYQFGTIFARNQGKTSSQINISRQGNTITVEPPHWANWNSSRYTITTRGNQTTVHHPHWSGPSDIVITRDGNRVTVEPQGWVSSRTTIERKANGGVEIQQGSGWVSSHTSVQRGERGVNFHSWGDNRSMERHDQSWQVNDSSFGSMNINWR